MDLIYNFRLATTPLVNPPNYNRGHLRNYNSVDVFKYTIASDAMVPIWTKVMFYVTLEDAYKPRQDELEEYIRTEFKNFPDLHIHWDRITTQKGWQELYDQFSHRLLWIQQNHDHIHIDNDTEYLKKAIAEMEKEELCTLIYSHWTEVITLIHSHHEYHGEGSRPGILSFTAMTKELYKAFWWGRKLKDDTFCMRTDHIRPECENISAPDHKSIIPYKEICRHFDGYGHAGIGNDICPALEIPDGFFDNNIRIRYGFSDRLDGYTNLNPMTHIYKACDPHQGVDYRWTLKDIPHFWKKHISTIEVSPDIDETLATAERMKEIDLLCCRNHSVIQKAKESYQRSYEIIESKGL